jgi:hypothetical protein
MPPINRLTQTNGRTRQPEIRTPGQGAGDVQTDVQVTAVRELKRVLQEHPGTLLVIGLVAGGIIGWLTSKRSR